MAGRASCGPTHRTYVQSITRHPDSAGPKVPGPKTPPNEFAANQRKAVEHRQLPVQPRSIAEHGGERGFPHARWGSRYSDLRQRGEQPAVLKCLDELARQTP